MSGYLRYLPTHANSEPTVSILFAAIDIGFVSAANWVNAYDA